MKKNLLLLPTFAMALFCACTENVNQQESTYPQPCMEGNSGNWVYNTQISDEFEAPFDTAKWYDHNPTWLGRQPSLFRKENVRVENGQLILTGKRENVADAPEGYHTFTTAAVQSKKKVLYGFFEIKCKPMNSALSSAFWLYTQDSIKQEEIDIFEICGRNDAAPSYEKIYFATSHYILKKQNLQISDHVEHLTEGRWADQWITAGLKWTRDELVWYVNGKRNTPPEKRFLAFTRNHQFRQRSLPELVGTAFRPGQRRRIPDRVFPLLDRKRPAVTADRLHQ